MIRIARLAIPLVVVLAAVGALVAPPGAIGRYACPMHPEVVARAPGSCPICGMALAPSRAAQANARPTEAARFLSYGLSPVHRRVLSTSTESPAWLDEQGGVSVLLFANEVRDLEGAERASFHTARDPGASMTVERTSDAPALWRGSLWRVRFRFVGPPPAGRVGTSGWLERPTAGRQALVVLSSAVLQGTDGPHLLMSAPDRGRYQRQPIITGRQASGYTVVVSGARERDRVFGLNAFSLDAEAELRPRPAAGRP